MEQIDDYALRRLKKNVIKKGILGIFLATLIIVSIGIIPLNYTNREIVFHVEEREEIRVFDIKIETPNLKPNAPQYELPLNLSEVKDLDVISNYLESVLGISLSNEALSKLRSNGFVVIRVTPRNDSDFLDTMNHFEYYYTDLMFRELPIFVTTDAVLHVYHIMFMNILKNIESNYLYDLLNLMLNILIQYIESTINTIPNQYETIKNSLKTLLAFFCIPKKLLDPNFSVPSYLSDNVSRELELINNADGYDLSPTLNIQIDYSLFKPRRSSRYVPAFIIL